MRALITGATGFIGRRLLRHLDGAVVLTRNPERAKRTLGSGVTAIAWDAESGPPPAAAFEGVNAVFHLAGEPVAGGRWTGERKRRIRDSRVLGTRNLVAALEALPQRPTVMVAASAVGYYGDRGDEALDENSPAGNGFLAETCVEWEREAARASALGMRVVNPRIGIVLGEKGGALDKMLPPFRLGIGGRLGSGRQWMPWIHLEDVTALLLHLARAPVSGPVNAVAPQAVTNAEFTRALARVLRRPAIVPVPAFALRLALGEMGAVLMHSQRVLPRRALDSGYRYRYPELDAALQAAVLPERTD